MDLYDRLELEFGKANAIKLSDIALKLAVCFADDQVVDVIKTIWKIAVPENS